MQLEATPPALLSQVLCLHFIVWVFHIVCISAVHWRGLEMSPFALGLSPVVHHLDLGLPWVKIQHLQVAVTQRPNYLVKLDLKTQKTQTSTVTVVKLVTLYCISESW